MGFASPAGRAGMTGVACAVINDIQDGRGEGLGQGGMNPVGASVGHACNIGTVVAAVKASCPKADIPVFLRKLGIVLILYQRPLMLTFGIGGAPSWRAQARIKASVNLEGAWYKIS